MAAAITDFRAAVKAAVLAEFAPDGLTQVLDDKMHERLQGPRAAVYPLREEPEKGEGYHSMLVAVQVFRYWDPQIEPGQVVDPGPTEAWAWRLMRRFRSTSRPNTDKIAWWNTGELAYPPDPTDNITRFVLFLEGLGNSPTLMETTA